MAITKEDLAELLSEKSGDSVVHSKVMIDDFMDIIGVILAKGKHICLRDFGTFKIVERKAKRAHNFKTGETIDVPSKRVIKFVAGKDLQKRVEACE